MAREPAVGGELVEQLEAVTRSAHHRDGDRVIQLDHRVVGDRLEQPVEGEDLRPVGRVGGRRLVVDGRDRGLQLVRADRVARERLGDQRHALGDRLPVPERPILLRERDQLAARAGPRRPPGVGEEDQREQAADLAVAGQQAAQQARQPQRLAGELAALQLGSAARGIPLVEDQVEDLQHGVEPLAPGVTGRRLEAPARLLDGALGAADPLRHRRLGHEEGRSDLARREPADGAQGERDRRGIAERGMAAEEEEQQRVVGAGRLRPVRLEQLGVLLATPARTFAADGVDHAARGDLNQPVARAVRQPRLGPLAGGRDERLLDGVLGGVEVVVAPHEDAEDLRRELAQQALGGPVELSRRRQVGRPPRSGDGSRACSRPDPRRRPAGRRPSRACRP